MVTINLAPGSHTIRMELSGYDTLEATINVSTTGTVSCVNVIGGSCSSTVVPRVRASGNTVTGYLKQSSVSGADMCKWVGNKGGWQNLSAFNIMSLVKGYSGEENVGFTVKANHIMGAVAYYSGNKSSGNSLSGCAL